MSKAARSILIFGLYLIATGVVLAAAPNALLRILRLPPTTEPWVRILGVVVGVLGSYYVAAARQELTGFFRATVWGRGMVLIGFLLLVLLRLAPPVVIGFALVDTAGALWTTLALRSQRGAA
jgi:hypothetical protein